MVGTSGRNFERTSSITASARTSPDFTRGTMLPTLSKATSMLPAMISLNCVAPPSRCTMRKIAPGAASSVIRIAR